MTPATITRTSHRGKAPILRWLAGAPATLSLTSLNLLGDFIAPQRLNVETSGYLDLDLLCLCSEPTPRLGLPCGIAVLISLSIRSGSVGNTNLATSMGDPLPDLTAPWEMSARIK